MVLLVCPTSEQHVAQIMYDAEHSLSFWKGLELQNKKITFTSRRMYMILYLDYSKTQSKNMQDFVKKVLQLLFAMDKKVTRKISQLNTLGATVPMSNFNEDFHWIFSDGCIYDEHHLRDTNKILNVCDWDTMSYYLCPSNNCFKLKKKIHLLRSLHTILLDNVHMFTPAPQQLIPQMPFKSPFETAFKDNSMINWPTHDDVSVKPLCWDNPLLLNGSIRLQLFTCMSPGNFNFANLKASLLMPKITKLPQNVLYSHKSDKKWMHFNRTDSEFKWWDLDINSLDWTLAATFSDLPKYPRCAISNNYLFDIAVVLELARYDSLETFTILVDPIVYYSFITKNDQIYKFSLILEKNTPFYICSRHWMPIDLTSKQLIEFPEITCSDEIKDILRWLSNYQIHMDLPLFGTVADSEENIKMLLLTKKTYCDVFVGYALRKKIPMLMVENPP